MTLVVCGKITQKSENGIDCLSDMPIYTLGMNHELVDGQIFVIAAKRTRHIPVSFHIPHTLPLPPLPHPLLALVFALCSLFW